jgi:hypothetical protein
MFKKNYMVAVHVILGKWALEVLLASVSLFVVGSRVMFPVIVFLLKKMRLLLKLHVDYSLVLQLLFYDLNLLLLFDELLLGFNEFASDLLLLTYFLL